MTQVATGWICFLEIRSDKVRRVWLRRIWLVGSRRVVSVGRVRLWGELPAGVWLRGWLGVGLFCVVGRVCVCLSGEVWLSMLLGTWLVLLWCLWGSWVRCLLRNRCVWWARGVGRRRLRCSHRLSRVGRGLWSMGLLFLVNDEEWSEND